MEGRSSRFLFDLLLDLAFCQEDQISLKRESSRRVGDTVGGKATRASAVSENISPVLFPIGSRDRKATGRLSSPKQERQRGQNPKPSPAQTDRSVPARPRGSVEGLALLQQFRPSRAALRLAGRSFPLPWRHSKRGRTRSSLARSQRYSGSHRSCCSSAGAWGFSGGQSQHEEPAGWCQHRCLSPALRRANKKASTTPSPCCQAPGGTWCPIPFLHSLAVPQPLASPL